MSSVLNTLFSPADFFTEPSLSESCWGFIQTLSSLRPDTSHLPACGSWFRLSWLHARLAGCMPGLLPATLLGLLCLTPSQVCPGTTTILSPKIWWSSDANRSRGEPLALTSWEGLGLRQFRLDGGKWVWSQPRAPSRPYLLTHNLVWGCTSDFDRYRGNTHAALTAMPDSHDKTTTRGTKTLAEARRSTGGALPWTSGWSRQSPRHYWRTHFQRGLRFQRDLQAAPRRQSYRASRTRLPGSRGSVTSWYSTAPEAGDLGRTCFFAAVIYWTGWCLLSHWVRREGAREMRGHRTVTHHSHHWCEVVTLGEGFLLSFLLGGVICLG